MPQQLSGHCHISLQFVTGTNELTLCASGRFFLREQFSFSGDVNFLPDPDDSIGTWVIVVRDDGVPAVELRIEQTTATSQAPILQFALGVSTLLLVVPVPLGAAHQAGAVLLLTAAIVFRHALRPHISNTVMQ